MNLINLKNKKVFITGGTAGIGLSILESFYKLEVCNLYVFYWNSFVLLKIEFLTLYTAKFEFSVVLKKIWQRFTAFSEQEVDRLNNVVNRW